MAGDTLIRTQISMTPEQADALRRLSAARGISQAAVIRDLLDEVVATEVRSRRIARSRTALGSFRSGESSTSVAHDDALAEAAAT